MDAESLKYFFNLIVIIERPINWIRDEYITFLDYCFIHMNHFALSLSSIILNGALFLFSDTVTTC